MKQGNSNQGEGKVQGLPTGQFFEIHGSKLKPAPYGDLGQTSIKRIAHTMLFLGAGKDALDGFFALGIKLLVFRGVSGIVSQFLIIFPNMAQDGFYTAFEMGIQLFFAP